MSTQTDAPAEPDDPAPSRRMNSRWAAAIAAVFVIFVVAVAVLAITRGDNATRADTSERIAATHAACQQWLDSNSTTGASASDAQWCGDMRTWMNDQVGNGTMMGSMMWGSPQAMVDTCRDWATTAGGASSAGWCDQMVTWMSQHMGNWDDGQDWDDHMGDGHWDNGMMGQ